MSDQQQQEVCDMSIIYSIFYFSHVYFCQCIKLKYSYVGMFCFLKCGPQGEELYFLGNS